MRVPPRYGRWKAQQAAKEERRKSRAERRARGEDVSDDEESAHGPPDESVIIALGKMLLLILMVTALAGQFITGSPLWGYKGKWTNIHTYLAPFTVSRSIELFASDHLACDQLIIHMCGTIPEREVVYRRATHQV